MRLKRKKRTGKMYWQASGWCDEHQLLLTGHDERTFATLHPVLVCGIVDGIIILHKIENLAEIGNGMTQRPGPARHDLPQTWIFA